MIAYLILMGLIALVFFILLGRYVVFGSWGDFGEAFTYLLTPDALSLFRGEWVEDSWAELKLLVNILLAAALTFGVHQVLGGPIQGILRAVGLMTGAPA